MTYPPRRGASSGGEEETPLRLVRTRPNLATDGEERLWRLDGKAAVRIVQQVGGGAPDVSPVLHRPRLSVTLLCPPPRRG